MLTIYLCPRPEQLLDHKQPALPSSIVQCCSPETCLSHLVQGRPSLQEQLAHLAREGGGGWRESREGAGSQSVLRARIAVYVRRCGPREMQ